MSPSTRLSLTSDLALPCYFCCPSSCTPERRPRLYWLDWVISPMSDVSISTASDGLRSIHFPELPYPDSRDWCEPGWAPVSPSSPFPTFVCASSSDSPHADPSGIERADDHAGDAGRQIVIGSHRISTDGSRVWFIHLPHLPGVFPLCWSAKFC